MPKLYRTQNHPMGPSNVADYIIEDGKIYRTINHPEGWSQRPEYELGEDGKIYPIPAKDKCACYEFRNDALLHRTAAHPLGYGQKGDYAIFD
jgi:hypothetical protein